MNWEKEVVLHYFCLGKSHQGKRLKKILIIDDDPDCITFFSYLLQAWGCAVLTASDGQTGINIAINEIPDLILCDILLPGIDGYEIVKQLKKSEKLKKTPILAVTAYGPFEEKKKTAYAGFDGFISKPVEPTEFIKVIQSYLDPCGLTTSPIKVEKLSAPKMGEEPLVQKLKVSILLIDDDEHSLEYLKRILELAGYTIITSQSVAEAIDILQKMSIDLVVTDLNMPGQTGFDLLFKIRLFPSLRKLPIILLTASYLSEEDESLASSLGVEKCLLRPIAPDMLLKEIESILTKQV